MWIMSDIGHHAALHSATGHVEHRVARFVVGVAGGRVVQIRMAMNHPPVTIFVGGIRFPLSQMGGSNINNVYMVGLLLLFIMFYHICLHYCLPNYGGSSSFSYVVYDTVHPLFW